MNTTDKSTAQQPAAVQAGGNDNAASRAAAAPPALANAPDLPSLADLTVAPALRIWFDDRLFAKAQLMAKYLANAQGIVPPHLAGKLEACFAVVVRSLAWKLDPYAVAASTYQTPGGRVGFEGKLCQAALENCGQLVGPVAYEFFGGWDVINAKPHELRKSDKGKDFAVPGWSRADALKSGAGVTVSAQVKGENDRRTFSFRLAQAFPLNSTLWATDPRTQLCYTAVRRFASIAAPGLFMGVPWDAAEDDPASAARELNPRPQRGDFAPAPQFEGSAPATIEGGADAPDMDAEQRRRAGLFVEDGEDGEDGEDDGRAAETAAEATAPGGSTSEDGDDGEVAAPGLSDLAITAQDVRQAIANMTTVEAVNDALRTRDVADLKGTDLYAGVLEVAQTRIRQLEASAKPRSRK